MSDPPLACFITFRSYGTWLHGDTRGSVDWATSGYGHPSLAPNLATERASRDRLTGPPVALDDQRRACVERAILQTTTASGWPLHAMNVRTNHVHVVLSGSTPPERMMTSLKAWSTRRLREAGLATTNARLWSRHGSTRYLWTETDVARACEYVVNGQDGDAEPWAWR